MKPRHPFSSCILLLVSACIIAVLLILLYGQAQGMMWGFDDYINLKGLSEVSSRPGLIDFVFGGHAGPGGRFISLASFVANYQDWPNNPWGFARLTLILHALNGALLFLLLRRLLMQEPTLSTVAAQVALLAAGIWLLLPIHASSILLPVQRMTHVSAFFMLITLYGYAVLRGRQSRIPTLAGMLLLSIWVLMGTVLAYFSKENGITVVTLVALLEIFFFGGAGLLRGQLADGWRTRLWKTWLILAAVGITVLLLAYLWWVWAGAQATYRYTRDFSLSERLATQAVISWEYLRQTLIPRGALLGPYQDDHAIYSWAKAQPYLALLAWAGLMGLAVGMYKRGPSQGIRLAGKYLLFAILWYAACHQIESTVVPLELYFEHRNYLAVIGIALGIAVLLGYVALYLKASRTWVMGLAGLVAAYQIFTLQQITSLWGKPALANEMWHIHHPGSTRATQAILNSLIYYGFDDAAFKIAEQFVREQKNIDVAIGILPQLCTRGKSETRQQEMWKNAQDLVAYIKKPAGVATGLANLGKMVRDGKCSAISIASYKDWLEALLNNEKIKTFTRVRHHVLYELALVNMQMDDWDAYTRHAQQAFFDFPSISMGEAIALELFRAGRADESARWIDTMMEKAPNGLIRDSWQARLQSLQNALRAIQQMHQEDTPNEPASSPQPS